MKLLQSFLLFFFGTSSIASKVFDSSHLQVKLDDNSRSSSYGWKISSELFHYFQDITSSSLNIPSLSTVNMSPLKLETVHGIWLLEKDKEHSAKINFDEDSEIHAYFQFASTSQLYDNLEITACLYGNSFLNVTAHSQNVILKDNCQKDQQPQWKNFTVSLGGSGRFMVEAVIPDKDDFLIIDKFLVSKQNVYHSPITGNKGSSDEAHFVLKETTTDCN